MSLLPPPAPRSRTHSVSTGVRPPLSISTLARSSANSYSAKEIADEDTSDQSLSSSSSRVPSTSSSPPPTPSFVLPPLPGFKSHAENTRPQRMFPVLVSRTIDLWRTVRRGGDGKHTTSLFASPSSTPRSSTETEYILPLSASTHKTAFDASELDPPPRSGAHYGLSPFPSVHASLLFVVLLFPLSTMVVFFCMSSLPITFAWPRTLSDLAQLGRDLNTYSQSGFAPTAHIIGVLAVSAVWKHAWSVPGSVLWNVLAGALFHPLLATLLMTALTTVGSLFSTLLATPLAPVLTRIFPRPVELTRAALEGSSTSAASISVQSGEFKPSSVSTTSSSTSPAWVRLSILRLIGVVPWSALNIACGLTGVALRDCVVGAFIGTLPWTAVTCQIGDILQTVNKASTDDALGEGISKSATVSSVLAQPSMVFELVFLTVLSLAPILFRNRLSKLISSSEDSSTTMVEAEEYDEKEMTIRTSRRELSDGLDGPLGDSERDIETDEVERRGRRLRRQRWTWQRLSLSVPRWSALNSPLRSSFPKLERNANP